MNETERPLPDIALVHLVVSHYRELQGLRTMADAGGMVVIGAGLCLLRFNVTGLLFAVDLAVLCAYGWLWWKWTQHSITAYYANRFGRVAAKTWGPSVPITTVIAIEFGQSFINWHVGTTASVLLFVVMLAGRPAWTVVRDWPHRLHWLLPTVAGIVAALSFADVVSREQAGLWWGQFDVVLGATLLVAGWFDHLLLCKTLKPSDATAEATDNL
jgi:hypothetical protein